MPSGYVIALWIYAISFYVFLYGPLVMITVLSFNTSELVGFPMQGYTLRWYGVAFDNPQFLSAFGNSLAVGVATAVIATTLALLLAMGFRHAFRAKSLVLNLIFVPIIIPGIIGGIVLLIFFSFLSIPTSLWTTVLVAHVNWALPLRLPHPLPAAAQVRPRPRGGGDGSRRAGPGPSSAASSSPSSSRG